MSQKARRQRDRRRRSMLPGGARDSFVRAAKIGFPAASAILFVVLIALPLSASQEFSFLLSKDSTARAGERMQTKEAVYRGETSKGDPFRIAARSGVQKTSSVPVVVLQGLSARIDQQQGTATVFAPQGEYFINRNQIVVNGPIIARSDSGYSLDGKEIRIDIDKRQVVTDQPVSGTLPIGEFQAQNFTADIMGHKVSMTDGVKLRIHPNSSRTSLQ